MVLTAIAALSAVAFLLLINYLRKEEVRRVNLMSKAIRIQQELAEPDPAVLQLLPEIMQSNNTIPLIILDREGEPMDHRNLPEHIKTPEDIRKYAYRMAQHYEPITIKLPDGNYQLVYYDNSRLLNNLRYSPYLLGLFIFGYLLFTFWFFRTLKRTDEGFVWAGLAKETAHQIGTPLSSLFGWVEILKDEHADSTAVAEIEKDVERLRTISERFSKIGSVPELPDTDLTETLTENYEYLKSRISSRVQFHWQKPAEPVLVPHSRILLNWVMENLVKNAVDAMKGEGILTMRLIVRNRQAILDIRDTGAGMTRSQARKIFLPGYSTKKRGWGLGLSLAKRVMQEYHKGDIRILQTAPGEGTTFRLVFPIKS